MTASGLEYRGIQRGLDTGESEGPASLGCTLGRATGENEIAMEEFASALPTPTWFTRVASADDDDDATFTRTRSYETEAVVFSGTAQAGPQSAAGQSSVEDVGLLAAFVKHFRRATTKASLLDEKDLLREAMLDCSEGGNLQTSMPVQSAFCSRPTAAFHLAYSLVACNKLIGCLRMLLTDVKCEGMHFRFTPLELRSHPILVVADPGVASIGLLHSGCGLVGANISTVGTSLMASFPETVGINGWWFTTASQSVARDPTRFILEASRDGAAWEMCGASRFVAVPSTADAACIGWSVSAHNTTFARGAVETFSLEVPWQFALDHMLVMMTHTLGNLWVFLKASMHHPMEASRTLLGSTCICSALYLASTVAYVLHGNIAVAAIPGVYALQFIHNSCLLSQVNILSEITWRVSAGFAAAGVIQYLIIFSNAEGVRTIVNGYRETLPLDVKTAFSTSFVGFCFFVWIKRGMARCVADARALVAPDQQAYGIVWSACLDSPSDFSSLERIDAHIRAAWGHQRPGILRQRVGPSQAGVWSHMPPIRSFERIFAQAAVAAPLLRSKVKAWALQSGGMFPMIQAEEGTSRYCFERWDSIIGHAELVGRVKWAKVKSKKRAVEKVYRCYAGDVSRLVDCCRCPPSMIPGPQ